jgi:hypothetical protein
VSGVAEASPANGTAIPVNGRRSWPVIRPSLQVMH